MKQKKFLLSPIMTAAALMCATGAWAQSAALPRVATIEVIGQAESMTQSSIQAAQEKVKAIPGGASVVDLNQVREGRQSTWSDSLGLAPGVFIQDRFGSEEARISIRGSALSRTYHSFGTKVMQDGVPINYADGFFDMQTVDPNASRYVEVLRGPNATTYGATTLGGAINFVAPTGYSNAGNVVRAEAGSFGYQKVFGSTAGVGKADVTSGNVWDYYVAGSHTQQDGFRDHAEMDNQKVLGNFGVKVSKDIESRFYVAAVRSRTQLPGYLTKGELDKDPSMAASNVSAVTSTASMAGSNAAGVYAYRVDANRRRDVDAQRVANKTTVRDGNTVYEFAAYAMNYSLWHPIDSIIEQNAKTLGGHLKVTRMLDAHQISLAYLPSVGSTRGTAKDTNNQGVATSAAKSNYDQQSKNDSFFIEDKYKSSERTTWTAALQYDRANRKVSDVVLASNNSDYTFSQWSPRVGVTHDLSASQQVFASVSRNFEAPIFGLTGSTTTANKAQTGVTVEFGTRGEVRDGAHQYGWDATYYHASLENEFLSVCANNACTSSTTTNIPKSLHQGVELGLSHLYDRKVDTRLALLYSDFKFVNNPTTGNNALPGFPPIIVRGEVLYRFGPEVNGKPNTYVGPKFEWVPRKAPMDNANTVYNDAYALLGFKAGQAIDKKWSWFMDARNLTNKKYAATTNIAANYTTAPGDGRRYYPGDGRSVYVGLEAKFD
ncbi:TonB-dependent receptor [Limnohabitans sp. MORI2]|uniref:TonB-dependent receptor family protein n=1 Tax=Limnohabitans sp. MORI2 TaxID=1751150 RepID=UPI0023774A4E|nr:TonB-dependent receptor [Limnohabitans sp. MORI2]BDU57214.1 TonB-dependent receptor [Limnohabitans sp. MORI2]